jgi:hypothetical protein
LRGRRRAAERLAGAFSAIVRERTDLSLNMASLKVPAIVMCDEHLIAGEVQTGGKRLLEVLNDPMTDWLYVYDAHLARRATMAESIESLHQIAIRKSDLKLALLGGNKHESPEVRRFAFVDKKMYLAVALVAGYEVRGRMHVKGSPELDRVLAEMGAFVPLTDAAISCCGMTGEKLEASVVLVNKSAISALHVGNTLRSEVPPPEPLDWAFSANLRP